MTSAGSLMVSFQPAAGGGVPGAARSAATPGGGTAVAAGAGAGGGGAAGAVSGAPRRSSRTPRCWRRLCGAEGMPFLLPGDLQGQGAIVLGAGAVRREEVDGRGLAPGFAKADGLADGGRERDL